MRTTILAAACLALLAGCSRSPEPSGTAATPAAPASAETAAPAAPAKEVVFAREELDQMVAPVALYPDPLLAQVLMAATYPGDVADAAAWAKTHPDAQGDAAVKQVANEPWDPSVQSLVAFPQALAVLGQDPAWVQRLGDAFLAQPDDVMDAVQRLRRQAQAAGNLESNEYQQVGTQAASAAVAAPVDASSPAPAPVAADGGDQVIVIQPADPQVVYVPSYNPTTVYGSWAYPAYPPTYYPPPAAYYPLGGALASGLMFGVGLAITDSLWGDFDWGHNDIDIDINRYNNINVNRQLDVDRNRWEHNPAHRDGVPYRDQAHRAANGRQLDGAREREAFRGDDPQRAQAREQARAKMGQHGIDAPARTNQEARERAQAAAGHMPDRAAGDREHAAQRAADRGGAQGPARDNARAAAERAHADPQAARERAAATAQQHQARDRAAGAAQQHPQARDRAAAAQNRPDATHRPQQAQTHRQTQSNDQARAAARQHAQQTQHGGNNAFNGAREPSRSHAQAQRGNASQAAAHRPASARPAGKPVNRTASAPQRHGGGRHR